MQTMKHLVFDFDGTIARTTFLHREAWEQALVFARIPSTLDEFLPYTSNLKGRYDSYERIVVGISKFNSKFLSSISDTSSLESQAIRLFEIKESFTIQAINGLSYTEIVSLLSSEISDTLDKLKTHGAKLGVLSSSRKSIVSSFLIRSNLISQFDYIFGEEDLYDKGKLRDKPDTFGAKKIEGDFGKPDIYIGDSSVDEEFAKNSDMKFIYHDYKKLSNSILEQI